MWKKKKEISMILTIFEVGTLTWYRVFFFFLMLVIQDTKQGYGEFSS